MLTNAGLIAFEDGPTPQSERAPVIADDVRYSLRLDELPDVASEQAPARARRSKATKRASSST